MSNSALKAISIYIKTISFSSNSANKEKYIYPHKSLLLFSISQEILITFFFKLAWHIKTPLIIYKECLTFNKSYFDNSSFVVFLFRFCCCCYSSASFSIMKTNKLTLSWNQSDAISISYFKRSELIFYLSFFSSSKICCQFDENIIYQTSFNSIAQESSEFLK